MVSCRNPRALICLILTYLVAKVGIIFELNKFSGEKMQKRVNHDGRNPASDDVDHIVRTQIDGGQIDEHQEHQRQDEKGLVACLPCQDRQDDGYTHMTAGEGGCGALARFVGSLEQLVEESVRITRNGQLVLMEGEVSAYIGEYAICNVVESHYCVIVLRTRNGQQHEHHVVKEERGQDDKRGALELLIATEEVEEADHGYQGEIARIANDEWLADEDAGQGLIEQ